MKTLGLWEKSFQPPQYPPVLGTLGRLHPVHPGPGPITGTQGCGSALWTTTRQTSRVGLRHLLAIILFGMHPFHRSGCKVEISTSEIQINVRLPGCSPSSEPPTRLWLRPPVV